jgi:hypothetical protein
MPKYLVVTTETGILGFDPAATGNTGPLWGIAGPNSGLAGSLFGLDTDSDAQNWLFLGVNNGVNVYEMNGLSGTGDLPPSSSINGPSTNLSSPQPVYHFAWIHSLNLVNQGSPYITVHKVGDTGNTKPTRTLQLLQVESSFLSRIALVNELLCVTDPVNEQIAFFDYNGNGNVLPNYVIGGLSGIHTVAKGSIVGTPLPIYVGCNYPEESQGTFAITVFPPDAQNNATPSNVILSESQSYYTYSVLDLLVDYENIYALVYIVYYLPGVAAPRSWTEIRVYSATSTGQAEPISTLYGQPNQLTDLSRIAMMYVSNE